MASSSSKDVDALQKVIAALTPLDRDVQRRVIDAAARFLELDQPRFSSHAEQAEAPRVVPRFSQTDDVSPKEFLVQKQPKTDVERVACLGYYLAHYRAMPHFKTVDLSKLNTEAAQPKFSNAAFATANAVKLGYLVAATKNHRQLSAGAEEFVRRLPDRDAARGAMAAMRTRRGSRRKANRA